MLKEMNEIHLANKQLSLTGFEFLLLSALSDVEEFQNIPQNSEMLTREAGI